MFDKDGLIANNPNPHSPLQIITSLIKPGTTVLDVGCNTGVLGKLVGSQATFDGIDINSKALKRAKPYYRQLLKLDLSINTKIPLKQKYDYIVFADILEHLPRPDLMLQTVRPLLKPNGLIIASIPNIARLEIRLQLLFGKFNYVPAGILNQDHLRFFTQKSARNLFKHSGYDIIKAIPTGLGHQLKILPNLLAFQFIYIARASQ
ncbi:class I SAM-dependent methyltransferase [Candidatus Shapirobacteria bacterium]|nr:class I SAM-dependent methyltransferase [Candidatus Shapirobacteria bacterium]